MNKSIGLPFKAELVPKVLDGSKTNTRRLPGIHNCRLLDGKKDVTGKMRGLDWDRVVLGYKFLGEVVTAVPHMLRDCQPDVITVWHPESRKYLELVPRHEPGDIAWMREAFCDSKNKRCHQAGPCYRADKRQCALAAGPNWPSWKPSIHLHRKDSRWERPLKSVRIELIQDITAGDAIAEGLTVTGEAMGMPLYDCGPLTDHKGEPFGTGESTDPTEAFRYLWDRINSARGWSWNLNRPVVVFEWEEK